MTTTIQKYRHQVEASVESVSFLSDDLVQISLITPEISQAAKPGQFLMARIGNEIDPLLNRPFSIHYADNETLIQLLVKVIGPVTSKISTLQAGETINLLGPLGHGFPMPKDSPVCLVGGGVGAAPLLFLAKCIQDVQPKTTIQVLLGTRNRQEAEGLAGEFEKLGLIPRLSTDDGSLGHHGVIGDLLHDLPEAQQPTMVYTCGPHPMLASIASICRENHWPCYVSMETMMGCGISACLSCAVPAAHSEKTYLHVCKNGPVFKAEELQW